MGVVIYGLNYRTAPVEIREKTVVPDETLEINLQKITNRLPEIKELFIVSTCNRTEFYYFSEDDSSSVIEQWLAQYSGIATSELEEISYQYSNENAALHLIRVASGLDSQVLGEPQILGQVRNSYDLAKSAGTIGDELSLFFRVSLKTAKSIRSETKIGHNPISVAYSAVFLAGKIYENLESKRAMLIGAGETIALVTQHLKGAGIEHISIANRTLKNARTLADLYQVQAIPLSQINAHLNEIDIIISSTGAQETILKKDDIESAMKTRKRRPMFIVDIAVPRDIESSIEELPNVYLYTIDHLTEVINSNLEKRKKAAETGEKYAQSGSQTYLKEKRIHAGNTILRKYRENVEIIRQREISKIGNVVITQTNQAKIIEELSHTLTNKLTHDMTVLLRSAIEEDKPDILEELKELYAPKNQMMSNSKEPPGDNDEPL